MTNHTPPEARARMAARTSPAPEDAYRAPPRTGPLFPESEPSPAPVPQVAPAQTPKALFTISAVLDGFPFTVAVQGSAEQLPVILDRLRQVGATPPSQKLEWSYTPDGLPICPKHGAPMRKRERQGDAWFSHVLTGPDGADLYCRGYHGKESPGYEH